MYGVLIADTGFGLRLVRDTHGSRRSDIAGDGLRLRPYDDDRSEHENADYQVTENPEPSIDGIVHDVGGVKPTGQMVLLFQFASVRSAP